MKKELESLIKKIDEKKAAIAKQRDELREIHSEVADLLESFDWGLHGLDDAVREMENAIDKISEMV